MRALAALPTRPPVALPPVLLGGSVVESYAHAAVSNSTGGNATGGLVGSAANALIADSYASGSVVGFFH
ncbi:MAG: hypothetical protein E6Q94_07295, partial [Burkholderiaceae bacterium]